MRNKQPVIPSGLIILLLFITSCGDDYPDLDFKQEMRDFVTAISGYAKGIHPGFLIIPQNGQELNTLNGDNKGSPNLEYLSVIDCIGQEDLFYGYNRDDRSTPSDETGYLTDFCDIALAAGKVILVTDYCSTHSKMDDSYAKNSARGYVSFAADSRELDRVPGYPPAPFNENENVIDAAGKIKNFLYLINPEQYATKQDFINAITATNYDLLIMDCFLEEELFTAAEIESLRSKANGGRRLVVSYMSIGEAEDYRFYWDPSWSSKPPSWLDEENPDWEGNYKVWYWTDEWKQVIFGNPDAYLDIILEAGFDGVYLDIIDAFEYFE